MDQPDFDCEMSIPPIFVNRITDPCIPLLKEFKMGSEEPYIPLAGDKQVPNGQKKVATVEELLDRIVGDKPVRFFALLIFFMISQLTSSMLCYSPVFTGYIPYTEWVCSSERCHILRDSHLNLSSTNTNTSFYNKDSLCGNDLQDKGVCVHPLHHLATAQPQRKPSTQADFLWTPKRSTFATEWGIFCENESRKSSINGFYFIGAFVGLAIGSGLYEKYGRKAISIWAAGITISATLAMVFANSFSLMLGLRVLQGLGMMVSFTGKYVWSMEYVPLRLRAIASTTMTFLFPSGTLLMILISYYVTNWRYVTLILAIFSLVTFLPLLLIPESPRLDALKGNGVRAQETLRKMARIMGQPDPDEEVEVPREQDGTGVGFLEQLRDFARYPAMMKLTAVFLFDWFTVSTLYYGLSFSWHKMSKDLFASQSLATIAEFIANTIAIVLLTRIGRKKTEITGFLGISVCFFLAIIDVNISDTWTLRQVACLAAVVFIALAFIALYLYTAELAPTSHRGMILCLCSATARVGSFIGPYLSLLHGKLDDRVLFALFGGAALAAAGLTLLLPDSSGRASPDTPADIGAKRQEYVAI